MIRAVTVSSLIFLFMKNVTSVCENVFSKRFSKEFLVLKNETLKLRDDCLSGVVLQSKFDGSFYCVSKSQNSDKAENLTCLAETKNQDCQCGTENPPPSSTNRIMYGTGMRL